MFNRNQFVLKSTNRYPLYLRQRTFVVVFYEQDVGVSECVAPVIAVGRVRAVALRARSTEWTDYAY